MTRRIIPVNFDNYKELYDYVDSKGNRAEFIRNCIMKEKHQETFIKESDKDLESTMERVVRKCLEEYRPIFNTDTSIENISSEIAAAAGFFDED